MMFGPSALIFLLLLAVPTFAAESTGTSSSVATSTQVSVQQPVPAASPGLSFNEIESRVMLESQAEKLTRENLNKLMEIRDPFERPVLVETGQQVILADLEQFSLDQLKLRGVMTGPKKMRALVLTPAGKVHVVAENSKIGDRGGVVTKITPYSIIVKEKFRDELLNTLETRTRELVLEKSSGASGG